VPANKEGQYLRDCLESLIAQTVKSAIICTTSTPNTHIENICKEYSVPLFINAERNCSIGVNWNFAYSCATTDYITLAHQDDVYEPDFLSETLKYLGMSKKPLVAFTDYYEIRNNEKIESNKLLRIKRIMCAPWRIGVFRRSRFIARRIFMFGNPICCPSVTFVRKHLPSPPLFDTCYRTNCDWLAWIKIRNACGDFVFCPKKLMGHRIHLESETSINIADNTRSEEDLIILKMLAPDFLAKFIHRFYSKALSSNKIS
jgi:glycosyltransferase involved in cell wall biosynthesis